MSTPSVSDIATALGTALTAANPSLRVVDYLSDTITPPVVMVAIETINYHGALGDADVQHQFTVHLILSRASDRAALQSMEDYMSQKGASANSIQAALEADQTLGGVVSTLIVRKSGPPVALSIAGVTDYIDVPFTVEVHA